MAAYHTLLWLLDGFNMRASARLGRYWTPGVYSPVSPDVLLAYCQRLYRLERQAHQRHLWASQKHAIVPPAYLAVRSLHTSHGKAVYTQMRWSSVALSTTAGGANQDAACPRVPHKSSSSCTLPPSGGLDSLSQAAHNLAAATKKSSADTLVRAVVHSIKHVQAVLCAASAMDGRDVPRHAQQRYAR